MNSLAVFKFEESKEIRTLTDERDGSAWFVLKDVLAAMGSTTRPSDAKFSIEDVFGDGVVNDYPIIDSLGRKQNTSVINEPATTFLISRSNTEVGKKMNRWIHGEVLPSIRKTGLFSNILFKNNDLVYQEGQDVWTSSLAVSEIFGKEHKNVVRDFSNALEEIKELEAEIGSKLSASFKMTEFLYIDSMNRPQKAIKINRPLFNYVVLNYTGKNSNLYRIKFIEKFEELDLQVKLMLAKQSIYINQNKQHVYVIKNENTGLVKVGISDNPEKRMRTLSNQSGCKLSLVYNSPKCANAFAIEQNIHKLYKDDREFGEWFSTSEIELVEVLKDQEYDFGSGFVFVELTEA